MVSPPKFSGFSSLILPTVCFVLLLLNVALTIQNRTLKERVELRAASLVPSRGTQVQELAGLSFDGVPKNLTFGTDDRRKTMLFVFSTTCGVCRVNWPNWQEVAKDTNPNSFRLVYANINSTLTRDYLEKHNISPEDAFSDLDAKSRIALNLQLTPLTILLSPNGTVERYWAGALRKDDVAELRALLLAR